MASISTSSSEIRGTREERWNHWLPVSAGAAGVAAVAMAIYQVATPGPPAATYDSLGDFVREGVTLAYLLASLSAVAGAWREGIAPRSAFFLIGSGYGLITVGVLSGLILQEDPEWFFVLAGPGLLLSAVGFVTFAAWGWRSGVLQSWAAVLLAVGGLSAIVAAELGLTVLIGSFWLYIAATKR